VARSIFQLLAARAADDPLTAKRRDHMLPQLGVTTTVQHHAAGNAVESHNSWRTRPRRTRLSGDQWDPARRGPGAGLIRSSTGGVGWCRAGGTQLHLRAAGGIEHVAVLLRLEGIDEAHDCSTLTRRWVALVRVGRWPGATRPAGL
jgi:hypothetical protein